MKKRIVFLSLVILVIAGAALHYWQQPRAAEDSLRHLASGDVIGFEDRYDTYGWMGIPFAKPPVDELRWRAPRPPTPWTDVREALQHAPMCAQVFPFGFSDDLQVNGDEDCLYLNVWTPRLNAQQRAQTALPVMLWIHGGGNTIGTSDGSFGYHLAGTRDVVVVTIQYRLGLFGWLSHPALRATGDTAMDQSSNFAILDMIAALEWVQRNIAEFGGNPDNVTVFGQSAGGLDVFALLASPKASGLFHRAIPQSGSLRSTPQAQAEHFVDDEQPGLDYSASELVNNLLIRAGRADNRQQAKQLQQQTAATELVTFLQSQSVEQLLSAAKPRGSLGYFVPMIIRDDIVIPRAPMMELFSDPQRYNTVPILLGSNRDEYKFFLWMNPDYAEKRWGILPEVTDWDRYDRTAAYFSEQWEISAVNEPARVLSQSQPGQVYAYRFDWDDQTPRLGVDMERVFGAAHGLEIPFVFGADAVDYLGLFTKPTHPEQKQALTEQMMDYWVNFARHGNPNAGNEPPSRRWLAWDEGDAPAKLLLDVPLDKALRMSGDILTAPALIERLGNDPTLSPRQRCERYAQLFYYSYSSYNWSEQAYRDFGCGEFPLAAFSEL